MPSITLRQVPVGERQFVEFEPITFASLAARPVQPGEALFCYIDGVFCLAVPNAAGSAWEVKPLPISKGTTSGKVAVSKTSESDGIELRDFKLTGLLDIDLTNLADGRTIQYVLAEQKFVFVNPAAPVSNINYSRMFKDGTYQNNGQNIALEWDGETFDGLDGFDSGDLTKFTNTSGETRTYEVGLNLAMNLGTGTLYSGNVARIPIHLWDGTDYICLWSAQIPTGSSAENDGYYSFYFSTIVTLADDEYFQVRVSSPTVGVDDLYVIGTTGIINGEWTWITVKQLQ